MYKLFIYAGGKLGKYHQRKGNKNERIFEITWYNYHTCHLFLSILIKPLIRILGIKWYAIWITWFLRSFLIYVVITIILSLIMGASIKPRLSDSGSIRYSNKAILYTTNGFVGFSLFFIYSIQVSIFTLLLGQIFSKSILFFFNIRNKTNTVL